MGVALSRRNVDFELICKTGDVKGAGTDSNVYTVIVDEDSDKSRNVLLDCNWRNDFEQGNIDTFKIRNVPNLGRVKSILLWRDSSGVNDDWFVEYIKVRQYTVGKSDHSTDQNGNVNANSTEQFKDIDGNQMKERNQSTGSLRQKVEYEFPFPINRWIEPNRTYTFTIYDSLLPQDDKNPDQRLKELEEKRERYGLKGDCDEAPKQVCKFNFPHPF